MRQIKRVICILLTGTAMLFTLCIFLYFFKAQAPQDTVAVPAGKEEVVTSVQYPDASSQQSDMPTLPSVAETPDDLPTDILEQTPQPFSEYDISLMAVGDNLIHMGVVNTGKQSDGTYDYSFLFEGISDFLNAADMKIINQETILGGNERGFSGFPYFNSPTEIGDAIAAAGFNVVLQASNHSADQKLDGLLHCVEFWRSHPDVLMTGIYAEPQEEKEIPLITIEDVTFAVLNYTYGPNMETLPANLEGHLALLCDYDKETKRLDFTSLNPQVLEDIRRAEELADVVIVCPHWGTEYAVKTSRYQQSFATQMTEAGADLIIGTHPHVVQPIEWITSENGNRSLCYYSLGNYVSTQKKGICMLEGMAWVTFHVTEEGVSIQEEATGILPLVCHYTSGPVRIENIYLLEKYTAEQAARHGIHSYGGVDLTLEELDRWATEIVGDWILSKSQVLTP